MSLFVRLRSAMPLVFCVTLILLNGCTKMLLGDKALSPNPIERPQINITTFSNALQCMDQLLLEYNATPITLTAQDINNKTGDGQPLVGAKEMLITSLSQIGKRSGRVKFVSYGTDQRDIILLHQAHTKKSAFVTPDYFIRGGITQLDKNVFSSRFGGALNDDDWNVSFTSGQGISYAGMDLSVGEVHTLQILPGVHSSNVLAVFDRGAGTDLGGRLNSVGTFFDFGIDRRDGLGQAIRNMVDLGVIELIGKLTQVPYMTCLPIDTNHPEILKLIYNDFQRESQDPQKLMRFLQTRLKQLNYYHGPINGNPTPETLSAIDYFRHLYEIPRHSRSAAIDFQLYKAIMYQPKYSWDTAAPYYEIPNPLNRLQSKDFTPTSTYNRLAAEQQLERKYRQKTTTTAPTRSPRLSANTPQTKTTRSATKIPAWWPSSEP